MALKKYSDFIPLSIGIEDYLNGGQIHRIYLHGEVIVMEFFLG